MNKKLLALLSLAAAFGGAGCSKEKTCAADERLCSNACTALQSDWFNCGGCGHACGANQGCSAGQCVDCTSPGDPCASAVVVACSNLNQVRPLASNLVPVTAPLSTDEGPISFARLDGKLYVANSRSSSISALTLDPPAATSGDSATAVSSHSAGFGDLEYLAAHGGLLWTSNDATGTLVAIDPALGAVDEILLAASPSESVFAQGIDFVGAKGYLALAAPANAVAVLDLSSIPGGQVLKRVDLAPLAPAGAAAMPSRVLAVGAAVYVTLNDLDPTSFAPVRGANGRLAVLDANTDALSGSAIDLGPECIDAGGLALSGTTLWVTCGFHGDKTTTVSGAALVPVELSSGTPVVGSPIILEHALGSIAFCDGRGYAGALDSGTVLSFDPVTRAVKSALVCPVQASQQSYIPDVACAR